MHGLVSVCVGLARIMSSFHAASARAAVVKSEPVAMRELTRQWRQINMQMQNHQDALSQLRSQKKALEEQMSAAVGVTEDFDPVGAAPLAIPGDAGAIQMVVSNSYQSLSLTYVKSVLSEIMSDPAQIEVIMNNIRDKRRVDRVLEYKYMSAEDQSKWRETQNKKRAALEAMENALADRSVGKRR